VGRILAFINAYNNIPICKIFEKLKKIVTTWVAKKFKYSEKELKDVQH